jgi:hypothetical protein
MCYKKCTFSNAFIFNDNNEKNMQKKSKHCIFGNLSNKQNQRINIFSQNIKKPSKISSLVFKKTFNLSMKNLKKKKQIDLNSIYHMNIMNNFRFFHLKKQGTLYSININQSNLTYQKSAKIKNQSIISMDWFFQSKNTNISVLSSKWLFPFSLRKYLWNLLPCSYMMQQTNWTKQYKYLAVERKKLFIPETKLTFNEANTKGLKIKQTPEWLTEKPLYWYWMLPFYGCLGLTSVFGNHFFENKIENFFFIQPNATQLIFQNTLNWESLEYLNYKKQLMFLCYKNAKKVNYYHDSIVIDLHNSWLFKKYEKYNCDFEKKQTQNLLQQKTVTDVFFKKYWTGLLPKVYGKNQTQMLNSSFLTEHGYNLWQFYMKEKSSFNKVYYQLSSEKLLNMHCLQKKDQALWLDLDEFAQKMTPTCFNNQMNKNFLKSIDSLQVLNNLHTKTTLMAKPLFFFETLNFFNQSKANENQKESNQNKPFLSFLEPFDFTEKKNQNKALFINTQTKKSQFLTHFCPLLNISAKHFDKNQLATKTDLSLFWFKSLLLKKPKNNELKDFFVAIYPTKSTKKLVFFNDVNVKQSFVNKQKEKLLAQVNKTFSHDFEFNHIEKKEQKLDIAANQLSINLDLTSVFKNSCQNYDFWLKNQMKDVFQYYHLIGREIDEKQLNATDLFQQVDQKQGLSSYKKLSFLYDLLMKQINFDYVNNQNTFYQQVFQKKEFFKKNLITSSDTDNAMQDALDTSATTQSEDSNSTLSNAIEHSLSQTDTDESQSYLSATQSEDSNSTLLNAIEPSLSQTDTDESQSYSSNELNWKTNKQSKQSHKHTKFFDQFSINTKKMFTNQLVYKWLTCEQLKSIDMNLKSLNLDCKKTDLLQKNQLSTNYPILLSDYQFPEYNIEQILPYVKKMNRLLLFYEFTKNKKSIQKKNKLLNFVSKNMKNQNLKIQMVFSLPPTSLPVLETQFEEKRLPDFIAAYSLFDGSKNNENRPFNQSLIYKYLKYLTRLASIAFDFQTTDFYTTKKMDLTKAKIDSKNQTKNQMDKTLNQNFLRKKEEIQTQFKCLLPNLQQNDLQYLQPKKLSKFFFENLLINHQTLQSSFSTNPSFMGGSIFFPSVKKEKFQIVRPYLNTLSIFNSVLNKRATQENCIFSTLYIKNKFKNLSKKPKNLFSNNNLEAKTERFLFDLSDHINVVSQKQMQNQQKTNQQIKRLLKNFFENQINNKQKKLDLQTNHTDVMKKVNVQQIFQQYYKPLMQDQLMPFLHLLPLLPEAQKQATAQSNTEKQKPELINRQAYSVLNNNLSEQKKKTDFTLPFLYAQQNQLAFFKPINQASSFLNYFQKSYGYHHLWTPFVELPHFFSFSQPTKIEASIKKICKDIQSLLPGQKQLLLPGKNILFARWHSKKKEGFFYKKINQMILKYATNKKKAIVELCWQFRTNNQLSNLEATKESKNSKSQQAGNYKKNEQQKTVNTYLQRFLKRKRYTRYIQFQILSHWLQDALYFKKALKKYVQRNILSSQNLKKINTSHIIKNRPSNTAFDQLRLDIKPDEKRNMVFLSKKEFVIEQKNQNNQAFMFLRQRHKNVRMKIFFDFFNQTKKTEKQRSHLLNQNLYKNNKEKFTPFVNNIHSRFLKHKNKQNLFDFYNRFIKANSFKSQIMRYDLTLLKRKTNNKTKTLILSNGLEKKCFFLKKRLPFLKKQKSCLKTLTLPVFVETNDPVFNFFKTHQTEKNDQSLSMKMNFQHLQTLINKNSKTDNATKYPLSMKLLLDYKSVYLPSYLSLMFQKSSHSSSNIYEKKLPATIYNKSETRFHNDYKTDSYLSFYNAKLCMSKDFKKPLWLNDFLMESKMHLTEKPKNFYQNFKIFYHLAWNQINILYEFLHEIQKHTETFCQQIFKKMRVYASIVFQPNTHWILTSNFAVMSSSTIQTTNPKDQKNHVESKNEKHKKPKQCLYFKTDNKLGCNMVQILAKKNYYYDLFFWKNQFLVKKNNTFFYNDQQNLNQNFRVGLKKNQLIEQQISHLVQNQIYLSTNKINSLSKLNSSQNNNSFFQKKSMQDWINTMKYDFLSPLWFQFQNLSATYSLYATKLKIQRDFVLLLTYFYLDHLSALYNYIVQDFFIAESQHILWTVYKSTDSWESLWVNQTKLLTKPQWSFNIMNHLKKQHSFIYNQFKLSYIKMGSLLLPKNSQINQQQMKKQSANKEFLNFTMTVKAYKQKLKQKKQSVKNTTLTKNQKTPLSVLNNISKKRFFNASTTAIQKSFSVFKPYETKNKNHLNHLRIIQKDHYSGIFHRKKQNKQIQKKDQNQSFYKAYHYKKQFQLIFCAENFDNKSNLNLSSTFIVDWSKAKDATQAIQLKQLKEQKENSGQATKKAIEKNNQNSLPIICHNKNLAFFQQKNLALNSVVPFSNHLKASQHHIKIKNQKLQKRFQLMKKQQQLKKLYNFFQLKRLKLKSNATNFKTLQFRPNAGLLKSPSFFAINKYKNSLFFINLKNQPMQSFIFFIFHLCDIFCCIAIYKNAFHLFLKCFYVGLTLLIKYLIYFKYTLQRLVHSIYQTFFQSLVVMSRTFIYATYNNIIGQFILNLSAFFYVRNVLFTEKNRQKKKVDWQPDSLVDCFSSNVTSQVQNTVQTHKQINTFFLNNKTQMEAPFNITQILQTFSQFDQTTPKDNKDKGKLILNEQQNVNQSIQPTKPSKTKQYKPSLKAIQIFQNGFLKWSLLFSFTKKQKQKNWQIQKIFQNKMHQILEKNQENNGLCHSGFAINVFLKHYGCKAINESHFFVDKQYVFMKHWILNLYEFASEKITGKLDSRSIENKITQTKDKADSLENKQKWQPFNQTINKQQMIELNPLKKSNIGVNIKIWRWNLAFLLILGESNLFVDFEPHKLIHWSLTQKLPVVMRALPSSKDLLNMYEYQCDEKWRNLQKRLQTSSQILFEKIVKTRKKYEELNENQQPIQKSIEKSSKNKNKSTDQSLDDSSFVQKKRKRKKAGLAFWKPLLSSFAKTCLISQKIRLHPKLRKSIMFLNWPWIPFGFFIVLIGPFLTKQMILCFDQLNDSQKPIVLNHNRLSTQNKSTDLCNLKKDLQLQCQQKNSQWQWLMKNTDKSKKDLDNISWPFLQTCLNEFLIVAIQQDHFRKGISLSTPLFNDNFLLDLEKLAKKFQTLTNSMNHSLSDNPFQYDKNNQQPAWKQFEQSMKHFFIAIKQRKSTCFMKNTQRHMTMQAIKQHTEFEKIYNDKGLITPNTTCLTYRSKIHSYDFSNLFSTRFKHVSTAHFNEDLHEKFGVLMCQIYSGMFLPQKTKHFLLVNNTNANQTSLSLIQALAGESGLKLFYEDLKRLKRQAINQRTIDISRLAKMFQMAEVYSPSILLLENLEIIASKPKNSFTFLNQQGEDESKFLKSTFFQIIYKKQHQKKSVKESFMNRNLVFLTSKLIKKKSLQPYDSENWLNSNLSEITSSHTSSTHLFHQKQFDHISKFSLQLNHRVFDVTALGTRKLLNEFKKKSILYCNSTWTNEQIQDHPWIHASVDAMRSIYPQNYSIGVKVAKSTLLALNPLKNQFNCIKNLIGLFENIKYNNSQGLVIIASTNQLDLIDPSLRFSGRLEETIFIQPESFQNQMHILKTYTNNFIHFSKTFSFIDCNLLCSSFDANTNIQSQKWDLIYQIAKFTYDFPYYEHWNKFLKQENKALIKKQNQLTPLYTQTNETLQHCIWNLKTHDFSITDLNGLSLNLKPETIDRIVQKKQKRKENFQFHNTKVDLLLMNFEKKNQLDMVVQASTQNYWKNMNSESLAFNNINFRLKKAKVIKKQFAQTISSDVLKQKKVSSGLLLKSLIQKLTYSPFHQQTVSIFCCLAYTQSGKLIQSLLKEKTDQFDHKIKRSMFKQTNSLLNCSKKTFYKGNLQSLHHCKQKAHIKCIDWQKINSALLLWPIENMEKTHNIKFSNANHRVQRYYFNDQTLVLNEIQHLLAGKVAELCIYNQPKIKNLTTFCNQVEKKPISNQFIQYKGLLGLQRNQFLNHLQTDFGKSFLSKTQIVSNFILSLINTQFFYSKNLQVHHLFRLEDVLKQRQKPFWENLNTRLLFEYFQLNKRSFLKKNQLSLNQNILDQIHQKHELNLENRPLRKYIQFSSSKYLSLFRNLWNEFHLLDEISSRPTSMNYFYDQKFCLKQKLKKSSYKWWNWHLKKPCEFLEEFQYVDYFPYANKYYNVKRRRWMLTQGCWGYWLNYEKTLSLEMQQQIIVQCFQKVSTQLDNYREILDYLAQSLLNKQVLTEIELITYLQRFN